MGLSDFRLHDVRNECPPTLMEFHKGQAAIEDRKDKCDRYSTELVVLTQDCLDPGSLTVQALHPRDNNSCVSAKQDSQPYGLQREQHLGFLTFATFKPHQYQAGDNHFAGAQKDARVFYLNICKRHGSSLIGAWRVELFSGRGKKKHAIIHNLWTQGASHSHGPKPKPQPKPKPEQPKPIPSV